MTKLFSLLLDIEDDVKNRDCFISGTKYFDTRSSSGFRIICFPYFTDLPLSLQLNLGILIIFPSETGNIIWQNIFLKCFRIQQLPATFGENTSKHVEIHQEQSQEYHEQDSEHTNNHNLSCGQEGPGNDATSKACFSR